MSALTRCARYARVFHRSLHISGRNVVRYSPTVKSITLANHIVPFPARYAVSRRNCASLSEEVQHNMRGGQQESQQQRQNRKNLTYSKDYPASSYWKKFDYSRIQLPLSFKESCNHMYRLMSGRGFNPLEFNDFMSSVEQKDEFTDDEVKLIVKTIGYANRDVNKEDKLKWTEYLSNRFISLGITPDVSYYNLVLRNYIENEATFSPVVFMSDMEKHGVAPNSVTLSRFIIAYCRNGDVKSASQILEHMKTCHMAISARVYNNLILGNFLAGDKETGMRLFRDTKEMGFEMDTSVYHAAVVGHAVMGDLDGMKEIIQEAQENYITFSDGAYSSMIEQVAPKGRQDILDYLMNSLSETSTYYFNESIDTLPILMQQGNYEAAYQYFKGLTNPGARLFYRAALLSNTPTEDVVKFSKMMQQDEIRESSLLSYFAYAVQKYCYEQAVAILPALKAEGEVIRPQYLLPLIQYYNIMEDIEGIKKILPYIDPRMPTARINSYLLPAVMSMRVSQEEYGAMLKEHSQYTEGQINSCMMEHCLRSNGWEAAAEFARQSTEIEILNMDQYNVPDSLVEVELTHVIEVMLSPTNLTQQKVDQIVKKLVAKNVKNEDLKRIMLEKGIRVSDGALSGEFQALFTEKELESVKQEKLMVDFKYMEYRDLLKFESMYRNNIAFKVYLLDKSYMGKHWDTYRRTLQNIDTSLLKSPFIILQAARYYFLTEKNLEKAMEMYQILQRNCTSFTPHVNPLLDLAVALCKEGCYEDAVQLLSIVDYTDTDQDKRFTSIPTTQALFGMGNVPDKFALATTMLDTLHTRGYLNILQKGLCLQSYWNIVSDTEDLDTILESFDMLKTKYGFHPHDLALAFGHFIRKDDKIGLQTVYDKLTEVVNEQRILVSLAAAFLENGQKMKARKVLATPGLRFQSSDLHIIYNRWAISGQVEHVEEFSQLTGSIPGHLGAGDIVFMTLKAMCNKRKPDVDACINFFETKFEEEGVYPDVNQLKFFSKFLQIQNRDVPFDQFTMDLLQKENKNGSDIDQIVYRKTNSNPTKIPKQQSQKLQTTHVEELAQTFRELLKTEDHKKYVRALEMLKNLSAEEVRQVLPADLSLCSVWMHYLMDGHNYKSFESLPSDILHQLLCNYIESLMEKPSVKWNVQKIEFVLGKEPEKFLSCLPRMQLADKDRSAMLTNALKTGVDGARDIKKILYKEETPELVKHISQKLPVSSGEASCHLVDVLDTESLKALAVAYSVAKFRKRNDYEAVDLIYRKAETSGLTFENVANYAPIHTQQSFVYNIGELEKHYNSDSREILWEPSANWTIVEKCGDAVINKTETVSSDLATEHAITDIASNIEQHTEVELAKKTLADITVAERVESEVLSVDTDNISDNAKIISADNEPQIEDKSTVIADQSEVDGSDKVKDS